MKATKHNMRGLDYQSVFAYCKLCGNKASAHEGDYWYMDDEDYLTCCSKPMYLAFEHNEIVLI